jgi:hypothetical protein
MGAPLFSGWPADARQLVQRACEAHGGFARWRDALVRLETRTLSGLVPASKGVGRTFRLPPFMEVQAGAGRALFVDYPGPGESGRFDNGVVSLVDGQGHERVCEADHRRSFRGWRKLRRWTPLDALYFFGYAITHYQALPFTLGQARFLGQRSWGDLEAVVVELPAELHTHCRRQTIYFGPDGLIRRHDYVADIVGWFARGAHFWEDYVTVEGLAVARRRHVVARLGRRTTPLVALHAQFGDVRVTAAPSARV